MFDPSPKYHVRVPLRTMRGETSMHVVLTLISLLSLYYPNSIPCMIWSCIYSDFGFAKKTLNSPCTPIGGFVWPPSPPEYCKEGAVYSYTSGYVLSATSTIINIQCACTRGYSSCSLCVYNLYVCLLVCLSVCLSVVYHIFSNIVHLYVIIIKISYA